MADPISIKDSDGRLKARRLSDMERSVWISLGCTTILILKFDKTSSTIIESSLNDGTILD